jgi:hypothetical protein
MLQNYVLHIWKLFQHYITLKYLIRDNEQNMPNICGQGKEWVGISQLAELIVYFYTELESPTNFFLVTSYTLNSSVNGATREMRVHISFPLNFPLEGYNTTPRCHDQLEEAPPPNTSTPQGGHKPRLYWRKRHFHALLWLDEQRHT